MSITALSEKTFELGSTLVEIPDFTRGKWYMCDDVEESFYEIDGAYKRLFC